MKFLQVSPLIILAEIELSQTKFRAPWPIQLL